MISDDWLNPAKSIPERKVRLPANRYEITARCRYCDYEPLDANELLIFDTWYIAGDKLKIYPKPCPMCFENDFIEYIYTASLIPTD